MTNKQYVNYMAVILFQFPYFYFFTINVPQTSKVQICTTLYTLIHETVHKVRN